MIVTFLRSSSIGTFHGCQQQYLLNYVMGLPSKSGKAAAKGNVVHKAIETLTWRAIKLKEGVAEYEDETFGLLEVGDITTEWAVKSAYDYYRDLEDHVDWDDRKDHQDCLDWTRKLLTLSDGYYDPMNMDIIEPEVKFDFTIEEPWARYSYMVGDEKIEGYLGLKGTVDLVTRNKFDSNLIEIVDYKSGKQRDFNTGKEKDYKTLMGDHQILLYVYALSKRFPGKNICFSIIFINFDGAFRMFFGPEHIAEAEEMLKKTFNDIRRIKNPSLVPKSMEWKCRYVCSFNKANPWDDTDVSTCQFIHRQVQEIGMDKVVQTYGKPGAYNAYGSGGGRQAESA